MQIMVISDIHGCLPALARAAEIFEHNEYDVLICCGDYLNHGPRNPIPAGYDTMGTAALLNSLSGKMIGVRGNCDSEVDQMVLTFSCSNEFATVYEHTQAGLLRMFVHHGHKDIYIPQNTHIVLSGHTHVSGITVSGSCVYCNPGSLSIPKNNTEASYAVIQTRQDGSFYIAIQALSTGSVICRYDSLAANGAADKTAKSS